MGPLSEKRYSIVREKLVGQQSLAVQTCKYFFFIYYIFLWSCYVGIIIYSEL